jgi:phosphogluconate dehydratase
VNAAVGLLATGGSTNHAIHCPRSRGRPASSDRLGGSGRAFGGRAADRARLSQRIGRRERLPAAGGMAFVDPYLLDAGSLHGDLLTVWGDGMSDYAREPSLAGRATGSTGKPVVERATMGSCGRSAAPFQPDGGMRLVAGNLGRATFKTSAVERERWTIEAPARIFDDQDDVVTRLQGGRTRSRRRRRRALPGPARQRHARIAQADAAAGRRCRTRASGRARHRRAHVRRERQGAGGDPPVARGAGGGPIAGCATATSCGSAAETGQIDVPWSIRPNGRCAQNRLARPRPHAGTGRELFAFMRAGASEAEQGGSAMLAAMEATLDVAADPETPRSSPMSRIARSTRDGGPRDAWKGRLSLQEGRRFEAQHVG